MLHSSTNQPDPDMPDDQMLLHFGEMTAQEMRTARAAIRFANTFKTTNSPPTITVERAEDSPNPLNQGMTVVVPADTAAVDQLSPKFLAQQIIFRFLRLDLFMSLSASVALLMVYQAHGDKIPISTFEIAQKLGLSPSTTTRLMTYLGEGREEENFKGLGLGLVHLQIDKKDRHLSKA